MFCDKELDEYVKIWEGTSYDETMIDDIFKFGYKKGRTETLRNLRESLEKKKIELENDIDKYGDYERETVRCLGKIDMIDLIINDFLREK